MRESVASVMRSGRVVAVVVAMVTAVLQGSGAAQIVGGDDKGLTYLRGQVVLPVFHGWLPNPDGTFDLYFSYINRNWQEVVDIPIGENNNISPAPFGPDGGQPTHFLPRANRWQFSVRVPADFGSREIVWSLTSKGETRRAYASLNPNYAIDEFMMAHEFGGDAEAVRNAAASAGTSPGDYLDKPLLTVEGATSRTVRVGERVPLVAVATDARKSKRSGASGDQQTPGSVGGDFIRTNVLGLRFAWFTYRGAGRLRFDPRIPFKVWEDQRGGSPWSPGWQPPPIPPGNKWTYHVTFQDPGTYVLRAQAHTGTTFTNKDITFTVVP